MDEPRKLTARRVELVVDSPVLRREVDRQLQASGRPPIVLWHPFVEDSSNLLQVDPTGACDWFQAHGRACLSKYSPRTPIEPVVAHFASHHCGYDKPREPDCAVAKAIFGLYLAVQDVKLGEDLRTLAKMAERAARTSDEDYKTILAISDRLRSVIFADGEVNFSAASMQHRLSSFAEPMRQFGNCARQFIDEMASGEPLKRKNERPALVNAEAELLESQLFDEEQTLELLRDLAETASKARYPRLDALRSRAKGRAHLLEIHVAVRDG